MGKNVGYEISGKSKKFSKPVLIVTKLSYCFVLVVPLTTQQKEGTWYVNYEHKGIKAPACVSQVRAIDTKRLIMKIGNIDLKDFINIKKSLKHLI